MNKPILISLLLAVVVTSLLLTSCKKNQFGEQEWSHFVLRDTAISWIARYDAKHESVSGRADTNNLRLLSYVDDFKNGKKMLSNMMARAEVVGIRIYYGIKPNGKIVPILVGLDKDGNDIYWRRKKSTGYKSKVGTQVGDEVGYEYGVMDMSQKSPPPPMDATTMLIPPTTLSQRQ